LKIISGQVQPDTGTVLFHAERVTGPEEKLLPGHKDILAIVGVHPCFKNQSILQLVSSLFHPLILGTAGKPAIKIGARFDVWSI
jgi:hypothetical protein